MSSSGLGVFAGLQTTTVPYSLFFQMTKFKFKSQSPSAWDGLHRKAMNSMQKQLVFSYLARSILTTAIELHFTCRLWSHQFFLD